MPDEDDEGPWEAPEVVELPVDGTLDLHTFAPRDVLGVVEAYLEVCRERGVPAVRLIHGKGKGVQRAADPDPARAPAVRERVPGRGGRRRRLRGHARRAGPSLTAENSSPFRSRGFGSPNAAGRRRQVSDIGKIYFPRLIVPAATLVTAFIDFLISFAILIGMMVFYQYAPGWQILLLPVFTLLALLASLGPGLWITALNVKYRDFRYVIPFVVQFGLYVSPVGFSSGIIPEKWRLLYSLNPLVGVIDGFRWCILGGNSPLYLPGFLLSLTVILFFLWLGISRFRRMEKIFADLI